MAAIPAAANLPDMKQLTYQTYLTDPAMRQQIDAAVRGARAQALQRYLFAPLARFCGKLVSIRGAGLQPAPSLQDAA
jgi:hypothetical protein